MLRRPTHVLLQRALGAALLCAAAGVVVYALAQERRGDAIVGAKAQTNAHLFNIAKPKDVMHISLQTPQDGVFELVRDGEGDAAWHVVVPRETLAEATTVEAMLQEALALQQTQSVAPPLQSPQALGDGVRDLSVFGLSPPRYVLGLTTGASVDLAKTTQWLSVGKRNGFDGSLFVQKAADANVTWVAGSFEAVVDKNLYKLRDKRVVPRALSLVQRLIIEPATPEPAITCERDAHGYMLRKPFVAPADTEQIEAIVRALSQLRGKSVAAESAAEVAQAARLSVFGLQKPRFVVRLWLAHDDLAAPASVQMHLGELQMRGATHVFARLVTPGEQAPIWALDSDWIMQQLRQDAASLRDMHVLHHTAETVARVVLRQHNAVQAFARAQAPDNGGGVWGAWQLAGDANVAIHASKVAALVARVVHLKAMRIAYETPSAKTLKACGLHKPQAEVDLFDTGEQLLGSVLFGAQEKDCVFVTTDKKDRIDCVSVTDHNDIAAALQTYYDTELAHQARQGAHKR